MSILKYYISTEYPVELSNELKDHVSIYSKRKSNNKLIILGIECIILCSW